MMPYLHNQIQQGLPKNQKMVWLLDCWLVQKTNSFRLDEKETFKHLGDLCAS
jgi:hypothetical protein